jgi:hypothetical protein
MEAPIAGTCTLTPPEPLFKGGFFVTTGIMSMQHTLVKLLIQQLV